MPVNQERLTDLLNRYANKTSSKEEENELFDLLNSVPEPDIEPALMELLERTEPMPDESRRQRLLKRILNPVLPKIDEGGEWPPVRRERTFPLRRIAVAASIILAIGIGSYFIFFNKGKQNEIVKTTTNPVPNDVTAPTATKAMITLADGRKVSLDSLASGTLATQGNVNVVKTVDGQIFYNGSSAVVEYNVIFNPRGSKVQPLTLSDGTKVWLNSESSLRFPTAFIGNERNVEITGEAYFEVAPSISPLGGGKKKPFIVSGNGVTTEVLGTHFNVNTYADESSIKVTLLEGSVKVTKGNAFGLLKPGQQAQVATEIKVVSGVNVDEVMAWKNGRFAYNNSDLETIMRQMARWYNVEVVYKEKITDRYTVTTTRDVPVSELFKYIEMSGGVHFKIEDRKITVMK